MTSKDILFSAGRNDECYTPAYAVRPILKYIPENAVVWCPFDTEESEFVRQIRKRGGGRSYGPIYRRERTFTTGNRTKNGTVL